MPVDEEAVHSTPFATLMRFSTPRSASQPKVLLVAPMSGHFATLLRDTVRTMLQGHEVYITDWHNIRDVPLTAGRFGLDAAEAVCSDDRLRPDAVLDLLGRLVEKSMVTLDAGRWCVTSVSSSSLQAAAIWRGEPTPPNAAKLGS